MKAARLPSEVTSPRMAPLARLPVFFGLGGKRALVAGNSAGVVWKTELLSAAGAVVDVFTDGPSEELFALASDAPLGLINVHPRQWRPSDFAGAAIAVAECRTDEEADRFARASRAAGVPANIIDKPAFSDFTFGAIVNRSPLVIGISTDGAAPVFAQAIRAKLETMIPGGFSRWAAAARDWRDAVKRLGLPFASCRRFWQLFTAHAVSHPNRVPTKLDFDALATEVSRDGAAPEKGCVALVGAGPGDPELLTLRAARALQSADVILIDDLVSREILDFARREAKKVLVGKKGHAPSCRQDDINALMISLARRGKRVVRLKGGDPMIFGRAEEEIAACKAAGIAVEIVPGITAAQGAASRLVLSLTNRRVARRLQYVTGHAQDGGLPRDFDWRSLSDPKATTVVYMPMKTLPEFSARAAQEGLDPTTAAVAVARATLSDEKVIFGTIADLAARVLAEAPQGPVVILVGQLISTCGPPLSDKASPARVRVRN